MRLCGGVRGCETRGWNVERRKCTGSGAGDAGVTHDKNIKKKKKLQSRKQNDDQLHMYNGPAASKVLGSRRLRRGCYSDAC